MLKEGTAEWITLHTGRRPLQANEVLGRLSGLETFILHALPPYIGRGRPGPAQGDLGKGGRDLPPSNSTPPNRALEALKKVPEFKYGKGKIRFTADPYIPGALLPLGS